MYVMCPSERQTPAYSSCAITVTLLISVQLKIFIMLAYMYTVAQVLAKSACK